MSKLSIREDSKNYCCTVVKLPPKQQIKGLDKLVKVTIFGNDVLTKKDADENILYVFFPSETQLNSTYLWSNNEYRDEILNQDKTKKGYFESNSRIKSIKFKGIISTGYIAPLSSLEETVDISGLKEGDEFTDIGNVNVCKKYKIVHQQSTATKESRFNKKLKRFDKLVPNQFRFHSDTSQLAKNLHLFHSDDIIVITEKFHGTSAIFSNVLINKKLTWKEKIAKLFGINVVDKVYDNLWASRSVIKNQYINKEVTTGYYNEDIWGIVNKELEGKIEQGISIYCEIVGYLSSKKMIQKLYDYGFQEGNHGTFVYRITYTKPDGNVIEYSWQMIKDYCKKHNLEIVKELYFGKLADICYRNLGMAYSFEYIQGEEFLSRLQYLLLERDCKYCVNTVPAEGICIRTDGRESYMTYKLKSKKFLERESKQLDEEAKTGEVNIENETS